MSLPLKETLPPDILQNWRTHIAYLRGPLRARFDMEWFDDHKQGYGATHHCGTVGCSVGHAAFSIRAKRPHEDWGTFSVRLFGEIEDHEYLWCFCAHWTSTDNTASGAAARMELLLEKGLPDDWDAQMYRNAPLCYQTGVST